MAYFLYKLHFYGKILSLSSVMTDRRIEDWSRQRHSLSCASRSHSARLDCSIIYTLVLSVVFGCVYVFNWLYLHCGTITFHPCCLSSYVCACVSALIMILKPRLHDTTGCQTGTGWTTGCIV